MTRIAGIDCGTNSVRLLIADVVDGVAVDVVREMRIVRLGQDVDRTGMLAPEAIERTRVALVDYAHLITSHGATSVRMCATSASRDASNRAEFVAMVRDVLGVEPEVLSGDEEAALSFSGATRSLVARPDLSLALPLLVMDLGGGSTELVLGTDHVLAGRSVDIGCVRLTERHLRSDPPTAEEIAAATADVDAALALAAKTVPLAQARTLVGLAGSVTTVAAVALGLRSYDPEQIHHARISVAQVREVADRLLGMTRAQRAEIPVMHPGRVDVIGAGALVLATVLERLGLGEVVVSEHDILDGIVWSQV